jgi:hypothetical protein
MASFAFSFQKPEVIGPKVAEVVGKELGIAPPTFEVIMGDAVPTSFKTVLGDAGKALFVGGSASLFMLSFNLPQPRPFTIKANVARQGIGASVHTLFYSTPLSKPVDAETDLENPKAFGSSKFIGGAAAAKLNANGELVKRANKLARQEAEIAGVTVKTQRLFRLIPPGEEPCTLFVATLARPVSMGMSVALDLKEFLDLADLVEKTL